MFGKWLICSATPASISQHQNAASVPNFNFSANLPPNSNPTAPYYGPAPAPSTPLLAPTTPTASAMFSPLPGSVPHLMMSALQLPLNSVSTPWPNPYSQYVSNLFGGNPSPTTINPAPFTPSGPGPSMFSAPPSNLAQNLAQQQNFAPPAPLKPPPVLPVLPLKQPSAQPSRGNLSRRRCKGAAHARSVLAGIAQISQTFP